MTTQLDIFAQRCRQVIATGARGRYWTALQSLYEGYRRRTAARRTMNG